MEHKKPGISMDSQDQKQQQAVHGGDQIRKVSTSVAEHTTSHTGEETLGCEKTEQKPLIKVDFAKLSLTHPHVGKIPHELCRKEGGLSNPSNGHGGVLGYGGASVHGAKTKLNLRRGLRVATWNIQSISEDHRLPHLSSELAKLKVSVVGLSETRRPGTGEIQSEGYTYYWSGTSDGTHLGGVALGISTLLQPLVAEVTTSDEHMMQLRLKHTLGYMSFIAVYAPIESSETKEKEVFYAKLNSLLNQCAHRDIVIVLGDFDATTGTERAGYEINLGIHGSGTWNANTSFLLNFAQSRRLRIAGSWFMRRNEHRWTCYSHDGEVAKETDHILVNTRWRTLENCRVFRSAEFFETNHKIVVATLKLHIDSKNKRKK